MFTNKRSTLTKVLTALLLLLGVAYSHAQIAATNKISDVRGTKHNLSAVTDGTLTPSGGTVPVRTVEATSQTQVCVFCHTPHGATTGIVAPLWNRALSTATYVTYTSTSIEATAAELSAGPGGSSKLCLSCHDGTMAIDKVNVLNAAGNATIAMTGLVGAAGSGKMPTTGATTGFTRNLGINLTNDHPISFTYDSALAGRDGELRTPAAENTVGGVVMNRAVGKAKPKMPLENNQMQCTTCHDPHLRDTTTGNGNAKFLRVNRFQVSQPTGGAFNQTSDTLCIACHDKGGVAWAYSAHANSNVATQTYKSAAANTREFPLNAAGTQGPPVWQVACLNCHDTHTVQGARRLLREGTDTPSANLTTPKVGGNAALEETCFQCHTSDGTSPTAGSAINYVLDTVAAVPNIKSDFTGTNKRMPIANTTETHQIGGTFNNGTNANCNNATGLGNCGKDLLESRANLGVGNLANRHAECSDCHNPHRVIKYKDGLPGNISLITFDNAGMSASGTHKHTDDGTDIHTNNISGVLRGSWGVEPIYNSNSFQITPSTGITFSVKRGDPGNATSPAPTVDTREEPFGGNKTYVTREYQICLKCHSNYGYNDDNVYPNSLTRPSLGSPGTSATRTSDDRTHTTYTNQAKEFQAPSTHAVPVGTESLGFDGGAGTSAAVAATNTNNHRSWHPVMAPTGRLNRAGAFLPPWNNTGDGGRAGRLGVQTMYCSDCHGSSTAAATVIPSGGDNGAPWGPHGSENNFLLKGLWNQTSGEGGTNTLCFKCHDSGAYTGGGGTGFNTNKGDGHEVHNNKIDTAMKCNFCHVAVPHGWKNRGLLVNLNDVGPEVGLPAGTNVGVGPYTNGPYYRRAYLKIGSFPSGGTWNESQCNGGAGNMKTQCENAT